MLSQAIDRIAERPGLRLIWRTVPTRIIARRMSFGAVGEQLDQGWPEIGPGALAGPHRGGVDCEKVVSVDAQPGYPEAYCPRRKSRVLSVGNAMILRDRPLVVDDIQDDRRVVDRGEGQGVMEVGFRGRALADPGRGDAPVTLVGRGHRPADGLAELGAEIAGN